MIEVIIGLAITFIVVYIVGRFFWSVCVTIPSNQKKMRKELNALNRNR